MGASGVRVLGAVLEGRYRIDELLARGGMSTVYRGLDVRLERPVAIKVMDHRFADDRSFIDRFEREARAAARLHHPGIVAVYDQGVDHGPEQDTTYLVMELVDGGTVRDLIGELGRLPVQLACAVLEPVLSALAAAHKAGLVHRDVKPENVLIGPGGVVKVADFGLVRAVAGASTTSDSMILGTVAYLAPEQVSTGAADARSDVYAAATVFYEMLTGHPPYTGDTPISVAYRHVNDDVPPPSAEVAGLPRAIDELVLRATRRDPAARPADAAAFLGELHLAMARSGIGHVAVPEPTRHGAILRVGSGVDLDAETVRTPPVDLEATVIHPVQPVAAGPAGPRGTRVWDRSELTSQPVAQQPQYEPPPYEPQYEPPADGYDEQRRRSRRTFVIWILVVLLLGLVVGVAAWWLGSGRWTEVPRVAGLDGTAAEKVVQDAHLTARITKVRDNVVKAGLVVGTDPRQGTRELRGTTVTLSVSEGRPTVPDVAPGSAVAAATQAIKDAGLQPRQDEGANDFDDTVPAGTVLRLDPAAGTQLNLGTQVTIVVSKGMAPKPVPNVAGMSHDDAFAALQKAGFQPYDLPAAFSDQVDGGKVIATQPAVNTVVQPGQDHRVGVALSNAVTVPALTGQPAAAAVQALQALGLQASLQGIFGGTNPSGNVFAQQPPAGTRVPPGSTVTLGALP